MTLVRDRSPLSSPAMQAKLDRVLARRASRDRLKRIREALARIQAELEAAIEQHRLSYSQGTFVEERWLREIKRVQFDLDSLEV
jgi:hypothetical protein